MECTIIDREECKISYYSDDCLIIMGSTQQLHDVILLNSFAWVLGLIVNSTETKMVLIGN